MKKRLAAVFFLLISSATMHLCAGDFPIRVVEAGNDRVDVFVGDQLFTSYLYGSELHKPIFYPLKGPKGTTIIRHYPMKEDVAGERRDHPHHESLWLTYGNVNGVDFWAKRPVEKGGGRIRHTGIREIKSGNEGILEATANWVMPDGKTILAQETRARFEAGNNWRLTDLDFELKAQREKVVFTDTKEGMFGIRVATDLQERGGTGSYTNAEGLQKEEGVWGKKSPWVALRGKVDGEDLTLVIFNHPESTAFPTYWHARSYGLFAANPFGRVDFEEGSEPMNFTLEPGASARFRYLVLIHAGHPSGQELEQWFQKWRKK